MVLLIVALAAMFAHQQLRTLRGLPGKTDLSQADRVYFHRQAWRRLIGCGLLVAIAVMISVWYLSGQDMSIDQLGDAIQARKAAGNPHLSPEQERDKQFFVVYWIAVLLLLLVLLVLMAFDLNAIRRFAARHSRQIRDDRRAMIERELAVIRRERGRRPDDPSLN
jgi:hypothetical protein